ncbi:hypothetical protein J2X63_000731 [Agromyces sp. 3263]|uniref:beta strand repeat-containing protein n=1 Tax=Agromyces sp. 3263 TaxID=2817750 RepID=UPI002857C35B|nr:Ig-like domain-containing protein [Agromyces sp. 3263]MDR6905045.1 hypothetical protein [Agromyces sp. 3263]
MSVAPAHASNASAERGRRRRVPGRARPALVFAAILALVVGVAAPSVAVASTTEAQLTFACAQKSNGLLRVATSSSDCRPKQETAVAIWPGPTQLCVQPDGSVRRLSSAKACTGTKPPGTIITVPTSTPVYLCAPSSGVLRRVSGPGLCAATETAYVIVNHAPSDLALSNAAVLENEPAGTTVGTLSLTDGDPASTPTFALVAGAGADDNSSFSIAGSTLTTTAAFDYEAKSSYSIRLRGSDGYGGAVEEAFTIQVTDVVEDVPPTAVDDRATIAEDAVASTIDVLANDDNADGGPIAIDSITQPDHGTAVIAGDAASVTYAPDPDVCNDPPGTMTDDFTYTLAPGGSTATVAVTVTCVDDLATASDDAFTVEEDAGATALDVLANDDDPDGGLLAIVSASDPAGGTVVLTGGSPGAHTGLTYQPDPNVCNDPPGTTTDDFAYTVTGGATATVAVTVACVNDVPVAGDDTFAAAKSAVGNTTFVMDSPTDGVPTTSGPRKLVTGDLIANDGGGDGALSLVAGTVATNDGGSVDIQADGDFVYTPAAGTSCTDAADFFDYEVTDGDDSDTGRVSIALAGCVWYVSNNAEGNDGTSTAPFDTLAQADAASSAGQSIFVFRGNGTSTGYAAGIDLDADQQLIGSAASLVVGGATLHTGAGIKPVITAGSIQDVVRLGSGDTVGGLELSVGGFGNALVGGAGDVGGTFRDLQIVYSASGDAAVSLIGTSGTFTFSGLSVNTKQAGVELVNAGTVVFDPASDIRISAWSASALRISGTALGTSQIDRVETVDSSYGGVSLANTTGAITFGDLALTTDGFTPAFSLSNAGTVTLTAAGSGVVRATGAPAVVVNGTAATLPFDEVSSTNSSGAGIDLTGLGAGTFSAASGTISGAAGTAVDVDGGSGDITYGGTIADGSGALSAAVEHRTGGTVTLSGSITDGSDEGGGVRVTDNTGGATTLAGATKRIGTNAADAVVFGSSDGHSLSITGGGLDIDTTHGAGLSATSSGTIAVTGAGNTIDTASGYAVTLAFTDIAATGVTFQRVSIGSSGNIVVNGTGTAGSFSITGLGNTTQGGDGSGGVISGSATTAVSLMATKNPSLRNMRIVDPGFTGVIGSQVDGFSFTYGTISGAGAADLAGSSAIGFTGSAGVTGAVTITDNIITGAAENGIDLTTRAGTISHAELSRNRISDDGTTTTPGDGILLFAGGTATTAATVTKATISGNDLTGFAHGVGIEVLAGNAVGGPVPAMGALGSATDVVTVSGNLMNGGDGGLGAQPEQFVRAAAGFGADANFVITKNGTSQQPIRHIDCEAILLEVSQNSTATATVSENIINAGNRQGCSGIRASSRTPLVQEGPALSAVISGNVVSGVSGSGIVTFAEASGALTARILNNTVPASLGGAFSGIRGISGGPGMNATLCLEIAGNVTAGGTTNGSTAPGIMLTKAGTDPAVNVFGIEGLQPSPAGTPLVEQHVNALNSSQSGTLGVGGTYLSSATSGFTSCVAP